MKRLALCLGIAAFSLGMVQRDAVGASFADDFNRPDGPVGNGWSDTSGNLAGNLQIISGELSSTQDLSGPIGGAGMFRPFAFTGPLRVMATIKETMTVLRSLTGANAIASKLSKARRAIKGADPDREKAHGLWLEAVALFEAETAWRNAAADKLAAGLDAYDNAIKSNIGLRLQERFTSDQAASIAACRSIHTDISLSF